MIGGCCRSCRVWGLLLRIRAFAWLLKTRKFVAAQKGKSVCAACHWDQQSPDSVPQWSRCQQSSLLLVANKVCVTPVWYFTNNKMVICWACRSFGSLFGEWRWKCLKFLKRSVKMLKIFSWGSVCFLSQAGLKSVIWTTFCFRTFAGDGHFQKGEMRKSSLWCPVLKAEVKCCFCGSPVVPLVLVSEKN